MTNATWTCEKCGRKNAFDPTSKRNLQCSCGFDALGHANDKPTSVGALSALKRQGHHKGYRADCLDTKGKPTYFPCRMEANYFRYLKWQKDQEIIIDFEYQPEEFDFTSKYKHGTTRYKPDFKVEDAFGWYWVETKGYIDAKTKTKMKRVKELFPDCRVDLVTYTEYKKLGKEIGALIPGWEFAER
jgi:hypothetical protein